jgi:methyl-accepting chemotaxis protein
VVSFFKVLPVLRNISLKLKLVMISLAPLLGFLWFSGLNLTESYSDLRHMEEVETASLAVQKITALVSALQRERGASGLFLGGQTGSVQESLSEFRQEVDDAASAIRGDLTLADVQLYKAIQAISDLDVLRDQIDQFVITSLESGKRYNEIIKSLIGFGHKIVAGVSESSLSPVLQSLGQLVEMKERAGRERAILAVVFSRDRLDSDSLLNFVHNLGEFEVYSEEFHRVALPQFARLLDEKMQHSSALEVARLQKIVLKVSVGEGLGVNSDSWFQTATSRIDLLAELERALMRQVGILATQARGEASYALWITIAAAALVLLLIVSLSFLIIRNIDVAVRAVNHALLVLSSRDLTARVAYEGKDEFGEISRNLNSMAGELQHVVREIENATMQVAIAAEESSLVTVQTGENVKRQQLVTELVVTAINEMSATVRDVARSTSDAAELSQKLHENTEQGRIEVENSIALIRQVSEQADQTAQIIDDLKHQSEYISSVLDVIRGVADQTNLLALNAAIEAARAGSHGRGFAVVASEVRMLAEKTQESTGSIQNMIGNLQAGAERAALSMQETLKKAQIGAGNVGRTGELLTEIADGAAGISDRNIQIAAAAEEQSVVAEDISRNVFQINDMTMQVSAGAEQTAITSLELARLAEGQRKLVNRFKLN